MFAISSWFSQVSSIIYIFWLKAKKKVQILSYCNLILFLFMFSFKDNWAILYCTKIDLELGLIPVPPFFYLRQFLVRFEGVKGSQNQLYHFSWRYFLFFWFGYVKEFSKKKNVFESIISSNLIKNSISAFIQYFVLTSSWKQFLHSLTNLTKI